MCLYNAEYKFCLKKIKYFQRLKNMMILPCVQFVSITYVWVIGIPVSQFLLENVGGKCVSEIVDLCLWKIYIKR